MSLILVETDREVYGNDRRALNLHSNRNYVDQHGNTYTLSRTLDGSPKFFEAYGPHSPGYTGVSHRIKVLGRDYWGDGYSWTKAETLFLSTLNATKRS